MKFLKALLIAALALPMPALASPAQVQYIDNATGKLVAVTPLKPLPVTSVGGGGGAGDASAANQTAVQAVPGADATKAVAVQGVTGGKAIPVTLPGSVAVTGTFYQATQPVSAASLPLPTGAATEATLSAQSAKLPASLGAKTGATSLSVVPSTDTPFNVVGNVAHDAVDSGNPVKMGCYAQNGYPTAVSNGDRANVLCSLNGLLYNVIADGSAAITAAVANSSSDGINAATAALNVNSRNQVYDPINAWQRQRGDTIGTYTIATPTASINNAITPVVGSLVSNVAAKTTAGNLYSWSITTGATAGYVYVFNSTTTPADGAVTAGTASGNYQICTSVAATTTFTSTMEIPEAYSVGIRPVFSSTACGTLTANATAVFFKARVK